MGAPRIHRSVVERIKSIWAEDTAQGGAAVWQRFYEESGRRELIGLRKVQNIVRDARLASGPVLEAIPWSPWRDTAETAEETAYLIRIDAEWMHRFFRHLWQHEARWAKRLRSVLVDVNPELEFLFIHEYGTREVIASRLGMEAAYTTDLDGLLTVKPWLRDAEIGLLAYNRLVDRKLVVEPLMYSAREKRQFDQSQADPWGIYQLAELLKSTLEVTAVLSRSFDSGTEDTEFNPWGWLVDRFGLTLQSPLTGDRVMGHYPYLTWLFVKAMRQTIEQRNGMGNTSKEQGDEGLDQTPKQK
jgi:hypothetical protein